MTTAEKIAWLEQAPAAELLQHYRNTISRRNRVNYGALYLAFDEDVRLTEEEMLRRLEGK